MEKLDDLCLQTAKRSFTFASRKEVNGMTGELCLQTAKRSFTFASYFPY
jgi:hypothetical protein